MMNSNTKYAALLAVGLMAGNASAALVVAVNGVVLSPDDGNFTGTNQSIQDYQSSVEASGWYNGSGLASSLSEGDTVPGTLPLHQYGLNVGGASAFQNSRLRKGGGTVAFNTGTTLTFSLTNVTDGLNGLLLWNGGEGTGSESDRGFASATASFSTDGGTTFTGSESLTFAKAHQATVASNGLFLIEGQNVSFANTYDDVTHVRFSNIATFNGSIESGTNGLAQIGEIRFTAVPEPSAALLGALGLLGLLRRRR